MKTVFADAFYFVALLNRADQHHAKVIGFARQLRDDVLMTEALTGDRHFEQAGFIALLK